MRNFLSNKLMDKCVDYFRLCSKYPWTYPVKVPPDLYEFKTIVAKIRDQGYNYAEKRLYEQECEFIEMCDAHDGTSDIEDYEDLDIEAQNC